ncbi:hypothetical protein AB1K56_08110 [Microbacterium sp. BWR-S6Y]|uniref:hypothetical protein n=1 Tax=Microbacterium sp. BWR-S6Y TaxID=3232073 RepID=UPI0035290F29
MSSTELTVPRSRGEYRKRRKPKPEWGRGDVVVVGRVRWIIRSIGGTPSTPKAKRPVMLHSGSTVNHLCEWNTTLALLPEKPSKEKP